MEHTILNINAYQKTKKGLELFCLTISEPQKSAHDDYYCIITAPNLFESEKKIYGFDREQTIELALAFIKQYKSDLQLYDEDDNPIRLESILKDKSLHGK